MAAVEAELQHLAPGYQVSGADGLADLLASLGPLTAAEAAARCADDDPAATLTALAGQGRALLLTIGGTPAGRRPRIPPASATPSGCRRPPTFRRPSSRRSPTPSGM